MNVLLISDEECPSLWDRYQPGRLDDIDLIISCGDLNPHYLSFLVTMGKAPLLYVHGNHDGIYARTPPDGCVCIEDKLVTVNGLRILGLGGSPTYNEGPHQYTEQQMAWRIRKLWWQIHRAGGVDIVVTHAAVKGFGDDNGYAHRGFQCFVSLLDQYKPKYLLHGHVHLTYGNRPRIIQRNDTTIINAYEQYLLKL